MQIPPIKKLRTVDDMGEEELYRFLRNNGSSHEQAVASLETEARAKKLLGAKKSPEDYLAQSVGGSMALKEGIAKPNTAGGDGGAAATLLQGATLNTSDEILGGLRGALTPGLSMSRAIAQDRDVIDKYRGEHPVGSRALEFAGASIPTALGFKPGAMSLGRVMSEGAVLGGIAGAGAEEGGVGQRLWGATKGAAIGAPAAALGYGAVKAGAKVLQSAGSRASEHVGNLVTKANAEGQQIASRIGSLGKGETLADMLGQPGLRALRGARAVSPKAGEQIDNAFSLRRAGQEERVVGDLLNHTGIDGRTNVVRAADDIIKSKQEVGNHIYESVFGETPDVDVSVFGDLLDRPSMKAAVKFALTNAEEAGDGQGRAALSGLANYYKEPVAQGTKITSRQAHEIKMALDRVARLSNTDPIAFSKLVSADKNALHHVRNTQSELLKRMDQAVPGYDQARAIFGGEASLLDALDTGKKLFNMHPDQASKILNDPALSEPERELMRKGLLEDVAGRIEAAPSRYDITKRRPLDDSTLDQRRLRLLFKTDDDFNAFKESLAEEVRLARGEDMVRGGSNTADKLADVAGMAGVPIGETMSLATGNPRPMLQKLASSRINSYAHGMTAKKAEAMTPFLLSQTPEEFSAVAKALESEATRQSRVQRKASGLGRILLYGGLPRAGGER